MDLLVIIPLNCQKNLHPRHPHQVLHPKTTASMMKAICQVHHPKTLAPMTNTIKMKRVTNNASSEVWATKNVDDLEINLERFHDPNIEILPFDENAAQIVQQGHLLAKKLPLWLNLRPSASQQLIYHGVFTSFQQHGPVSVDALLKAMEVILDIKLVKVTRPNNNHVVKENQMVASVTKS